MKHFKLDLMTILFIVVIMGVVLTMTSQAGDRSSVDLVDIQAASRITTNTPSNVSTHPLSKDR